MRVHGESQALPVLEEARLTDTQGSRSERPRSRRSDVSLSLSLFLSVCLPLF